MARLDLIRADLAQGVPLTGIYEQHRTALGIGYPSFVKLVGRYADDVRVTRRRTNKPAGEPAPPGPGRPPSPPKTIDLEPRDEQQPARRTFRPVSPRED